MQGKLLALMMDQFLKYNTGDADHEVLQCMFCLFGISVSVSPGVFGPVDNRMMMDIHFHTEAFYDRWMGIWQFVLRNFWCIYIRINDLDLHS